MLLLSGFASDLAIFFGPVLHILRCMSALLAGTQLMADACGVSISLFYILVCILARDVAAWPRWWCRRPSMTAGCKLACDSFVVAC